MTQKLVNGELVDLTPEEQAAYDAAQSAPIVPSVPDNPTLGDWRVALLLWGRLSDVQKKVSDLKAAGNPLGAVADERMNYSNNVLLAQLLQLKDVFGFTEDEVKESLWRANQVSKGDLSGVWPLPASGA